MERIKERGKKKKQNFTRYTITSIRHWGWKTGESRFPYGVWQQLDDSYIVRDTKIRRKENLRSRKPVEGGGGGFPLPSRHRTVGTVCLQPPYKFHGEEDPTAILLREGSFRRAGPARRYFRVTVYVFRVLIGGLAFSYRRNRSTR